MSGEREMVTVLLVENNAQLMKHMQKTLGLIDKVDLINTSLLAQEALDVIRDQKPLVALVDYNLPDMNGINLTEIIRKEFPGTQVIVISQDNYTDVVLQAVRAGACDFITHDVSVKELTDVLTRAATLAVQDRSKLSAFAGVATPERKVAVPSGSQGKVVAVYGAKGGIGTTTVAANLALALMDRDHDARVVLVDGAIQYGDVHLMFNELGQASVMDLVPRLNELDIELVENVMLFNRPTGISILPAPPRPEFAEKITGEAFARILEFLRRHYDYVVLNTDSYVSDAVLAALDASEVVVLLTAQSINAIRNTRLFLDLWNAMGMTRDRIQLVISRYDPTSPITTERVGERLKFPVNMVLPEDNEAARKADALGQPALRSTRDSVFSKALYGLADQTINRIAAVEKSEEPRMRMFVTA
ncbi:MAG: response regulator [Bellilinea sp.]